MPPPPSWWPPAPGWWVLALLALVLLGWAGWRWIDRRRRLRARRALVALVDRVLVDTEGRPQDTAAGLHALLRRAARRLDRGADTHRGPMWRATLERVNVDPSVIARLIDLDTLMYRPSMTWDRDGLADAVRDWLAALADQTGRIRAGEGLPR
ncbi:MAG: DUF4381 family protein [Xanthomonadaceae bacterium]|nr:DUF4381 family protein [Xanthomonadaceae bacterium]